MDEPTHRLARAIRAAAAPENLPYTLLGILAAVSTVARVVLILR